MTDKTPVQTLDAQQSVSTWRERLNELVGVARGYTVASYAANTTLADNVDLAAGDATSGPITLSLPASPSNGDTYEIVKLDVTGNAVTIARNGNLINLGTADVPLTVPAQFRRLTWIASLNTWLSR